jgi:hypothetical protein
MNLFAHWTFDRWSVSNGGARKASVRLVFLNYRYDDVGVDEVKYGTFVEEIAAFHPILEEHRLDFICFTRLNIESVAD